MAKGQGPGAEIAQSCCKERPLVLRPQRLAHSEQRTGVATYRHTLVGRRHRLVGPGAARTGSAGRIRNHRRNGANLRFYLPNGKISALFFTKMETRILARAHGRGHRVRNAVKEVHDEKAFNRSRRAVRDSADARPAAVTGILRLLRRRLRLRHRMERLGWTRLVGSGLVGSALLGGTGLRLAPPLLWLSPLALDTPLPAAPLGIPGLCHTTTVLASAGLSDNARNSNPSGTQGEVS